MKVDRNIETSNQMLGFAWGLEIHLMFVWHCVGLYICLLKSGRRFK